MRLSAKMILFNVLAKGMILLGFLVSGPYLLKKYAISYTDNRLEEKKEQVLNIIEEVGIESFFQGDSVSGYGSYNLLKEEYISLERIADDAAIDTIFNEQRIIEEEVVSYRVLSYTFADEENIYLLEIGRSLTTIQQIEKVFTRLIVIAIVVFIALSIFFDGLFHNILLKPFRKIIYEKLPEIKEPHQYAFTPIETKTHDFRILDEAIGDMMNRVQQVFNRERVFIAHASHELRTPISVLQSKVENMLSDSTLNERETQRLMEMQQTIQRFKHLVNSLLLISKISNSQYLKNEEVDLNQMIDELTDEWAPVAGGKDIEIEKDMIDGIVIPDSNYSMVMMMIQNALTNAIRYTPTGGRIRITGKLVDQTIHIEVSDTGEGIKKELLDQVKAGVVFLKDATSERSGFGLQIMNKIANYLGVDLHIESSSKGTRVRFVFNRVVRKQAVA